MSYELIYDPEEDEYRVYSDICDKLCIERFYKKDLKSQTHINNFYRRQIFSNKLNLIKWWIFFVEYVIN